MIRKFVMAVGLFSLSSCQEQMIMQEDCTSSNFESMALDSDSLMIYMRQSSQAEILKNLIRCENDRFYLDLSLEDASDLGISPLSFESINKQLEQLNNSNIKPK